MHGEYLIIIDRHFFEVYIVYIQYTSCTCNYIKTSVHFLNIGNAQEANLTYMYENESNK